MADERDELDEVLDTLERAWKEIPDHALSDTFCWADVERARSIRARERKLAELAREAYERSSQRRRMTTSWMLRYEEACK